LGGYSWLCLVICVDAIFYLMTWQLLIRLSACNLKQSKGPPEVGRRNLLRRPSQLKE